LPSQLPGKQERQPPELLMFQWLIQLPMQLQYQQPGQLKCQPQTQPPQKLEQQPPEPLMFLRQIL
jgi:hypothetical protein